MAALTACTEQACWARGLAAPFQLRCIHNAARHGAHQAACAACRAAAAFPKPSLLSTTTTRLRDMPSATLPSHQSTPIDTSTPSSTPASNNTIIHAPA